MSKRAEVKDFSYGDQQLFVPSQLVEELGPDIWCQNWRIRCNLSFQLFFLKFIAWIYWRIVTREKTPSFMCRVPVVLPLNQRKDQPVIDLTKIMLNQTGVFCTNDRPSYLCFSVQPLELLSLTQILMILGVAGTFELEKFRLTRFPLRAKNIQLSGHGDPTRPQVNSPVPSQVKFSSLLPRVLRTSLGHEKLKVIKYYVQCFVS